MRSATLLNLRSLKGAQLVSPSAVTQFRPGSQALQASAGRPSQWAISCSRRGDSARGHQAAARPSREQPTSPGKTLRVAQRSCCSAVRSRVMAGRGEPASLGRGISGLTVAAASDHPSASGPAPDCRFRFCTHQQLCCKPACNTTLRQSCLPACIIRSLHTNTTSCRHDFDALQCCRSRCKC